MSHDHEAYATRTTGAPVPTRNGVMALPDEIMILGPWRIDTVSRSVTDGNRTSRLSPRAMRMIQALANADGGVLSREALISAIWPDVTVTDESLTQTVTEVRRILRDRAGPSRLIETIPRYGYRLCVTVDVITRSESTALPKSGHCFDLDSYQLCLDARSVLVRGAADAISLPVILTEEAVARAPGFALARAEYSIALSYRWLYQRQDATGLERAIENADMAVALRPDQATGYVAKAFAHGALGKNDQMRNALEKGLSLDCGDSELHMLGARALFAAGHHKSAASLAERAAELNPDDFRARFFASRAAANFDPARSELNARACLVKLRSRLAYSPADPRALHTLGPVLAVLGMHEDAAEAIEVNQLSDPSPCMFYDSIGYAAIGELDKAADCLANVVDLGWRHPAWIRSEPAFDKARAHRKFDQTVASLQAA